MPWGPRLASGGDLSPDLESYQQMIGEAAGRFGVDHRLIMMVILVESGGNPQTSSLPGEDGLVQVMPSTFTGMGYGLRFLNDPNTNIEAGTRYLLECLAAFRSLVGSRSPLRRAADARCQQDSYRQVPAWFAFGTRCGM